MRTALGEQERLDQTHQRGDLHRIMFIYQSLDAVQPYSQTHLG